MAVLPCKWLKCYVVAYSGQSHQSSRIPFFKLADQYVPKPTPALTWKEILDDIIERQLAPGRMWESLKAVLLQKGCSQKQIDKLQKSVLRAIKGGAIDMRSAVKICMGAVDGVATVVAVVMKIVELCAGA